MLHRDGLRQPLEGFHDWAFNVLKAVVAFEAGFWGVGSWAANGEPVVHNVHLHGPMPATMNADWETLKMDPAHQAILKQLSTVGGSVAFGPEMLAADPFCSKYGIVAVVTNCFIDPTTRLLHIFSFYRLAGGAPFDERECRLHQALAPHAFDVEREVWLRQFSGPLSAGCEAQATDNQSLCDGEGTLRLAQRGFVRAILEEWHGWQGPEVPQPLLEAIREGRSEVVGEHTVVALARRHDMLILSARARGPVDDLTPREKAVALSWGRGGTAKQIAAQMGISPATVRNHVARIYDKLTVTGRQQLVKALGVVD